jgi:peptidoglycan/xylan/chitin deacetylase (PgdA/CDA1 family)
VVAALALGLLSAVTPFTPQPPHRKALSVAAPALPVPTPVVRTEMALTPGSRPAVALTFDDGPDPRWTPGVLDLLRRHGAVATFCVVGGQVEAHPDLVADIVAAGHRLCDHTRTHDEGLPGRGADQMAAEIAGARDDIAAVVDARVAYFRAPGGNWSPDVLDVAVGSGMQPLGWSVDPRDWRRPGVAAIVEAVQRDVRPGAVILLHDGGGPRDQTVAALERLLPWLVDRGYAFGFPTR